MSDLPVGWQRRRLEQVAEVNPGPSKALPENLEVSFVAMADVSEGGEILSRTPRMLSEVRGGFTYFEDGDVLIAKITPCFENGKGALAGGLTNGIGFGSTEFHVLRPREGVVPEFLFLTTRTHEFRANGAAHMVGSAGQQRVPTEFIRYYALLLPPRPEQIGIVGIVGRWDAAIALTEKAIAAKRVGRRGLMQQLLTGKTRFGRFKGDRWRMVRIGDLLEPVNRYEKWDDGRIYRLAGVRRNGGGLFFRDELPGTEIKVKVCKKLRAGDFLISRRQMTYGGMALVPAEFDGFDVNDEYEVLAVRDRAKFEIRFFSYLAETPELKYAAYVASNGFFAERLRLNLDLEQFLSHRICIPPSLGELREIVSVLDAATQEIELLQKQLNALNEQKRGLMQKLLTGEVRVKPEKQKAESRKQKPGALEAGK